MRTIISTALAFVALCLGPAAHAQEQVGSVSAIEGSAEVRRGDAGAWTAVASGSPVLLGDHLRTLADSKLRVVLREDSVLTLAANSELAVTEQVIAPAPVSRLQVLFGTLKAIVTERYGGPQAQFEVETPTAVAGVHGTGFIASYDATADETVVVGLYDRTWVRSRIDPTTVELGPGAKTVVRRGQLPARPFPVPQHEMRRMNSALALRIAGTIPRKEFGLRRSAGTKLRPGEGARSPQGQVVDQPGLPTGKGKPPPPPPPVPHGH